jgi:8-oxo-dGTP diphosphatase
MSAPAIVLVAAAALIDVDGRVLVAKRPEGKTMAGLWEFPGGKVAHGETPEVALVRELAEELAIEVCETCLYPLSFASHAYEDFHLLMPLFACRKWEGIPAPQEGQDIRWLHPNALTALAMPPADAPLVQALRDLL